MAPDSLSPRLEVDPLVGVAVGEPANSASVPVLLVVTVLVSVKSLISEVLAADAEPAKRLMVLLVPVSVMLVSMFTVPVAWTVTLPVPEMVLAMLDKLKAPER